MHVICRWVSRTSCYSVDSALVDDWWVAPNAFVQPYGVIPYGGAPEDIDVEQSNSGSRLAVRLASPKRNIEAAIVNIDGVDG